MNIKLSNILILLCNLLKVRQLLSCSEKVQNKLFNCSVIMTIFTIVTNVKGENRTQQISNNLTHLHDKSCKNS